MGGQIITSDRGQFGDHQYGLYVDHILHELLINWATMDYFFQSNDIFSAALFESIGHRRSLEISCELNVLYIKSFFIR